MLAQAEGAFAGPVATPDVSEQMTRGWMSTKRAPPIQATVDGEMAEPYAETPDS